MKNSMKKLLAVLMAATMMIAFGACGGSESGTDGSADEGPRVLKMSHHIAETDSSAILAEKFAELVNEKSGGKLKIEIYGNGQLYGQADALEALKMGSLDLAMSDTSLYSNYDTGCGILDMPYVFQSRKQAINATKDEKIMGNITERLVSAAGIRPVYINACNFRNTFSSKDASELNEFPTFKNLKIRTPEAPTIISCFEAIGASPNVIPSGEAYTAMQTGVVDALEGHAEYMVNMKFYEVAKNYVQTEHVMTFTAMNMSEKTWESLSAEEQQIITEASQEALDYFYDFTTEVYEKAYAELENNGVVITSVDKTPFINACKPYVEKFVKDNQLEDLYEEINNLEV